MLSKGLDVRWVDLSWPVKCTYIRVLVYVFNREVFLGAGINPSLALIPWLGFGNGSNAFCPEFIISFKNLSNLSGYLESLLHSPQQQRFVPTILHEI